MYFTIALGLINAATWVLKSLKTGGGGLHTLAIVQSVASASCLELSGQLSRLLLAHNNSMLPVRSAKLESFWS